MPRGRPVGAKNVKTLEREALEAREREVREAEAKAWVADKTVTPVTVKKLAKEVLDDLMNLYMGLTAHYQPWPAARGKNPHEDISKFNYYSQRAAEVAAALTPYQSPRLSAVAIGAAIVNRVEVVGGMPDDFAPPTKDGQVIEFKPGQVVTPSDFRESAKKGVA